MIHHRVSSFMDFPFPHFYTATSMNTASNEAETENFGGIAVAAFESRMAKEMENLILRHGGKPHVAPSMREVPLSENRGVLDFFSGLQQGAFQVVIFMTGVGTRTLFQSLELGHSKAQILQAFQKATLVARGPKSVKALSDYGLTASLIVPEPNTWREVLSLLDSKNPVKGLRLAVQEYGVSNPEFLKALKDRGAEEVLSVPVYRWALPEDPQPLVHLMEAILKGEIRMALFTSATQVQNVLHVAKGLGKEPQLREAFKKISVGSIGPIASEALAEAGLHADFEPGHPKMGFLVKEAARKASQLSKDKSVLSVPLNGPPSPGETGKDPLLESLFLKSCRREPTARRPLWIMRQAGRYLPEYRAVRSKVPFLELCKTPDLAAQVTVEAQQVLEVDAAILFADILLIAEPMGFELEFAEDVGPLIHNPFQSESDLGRLRAVEASQDLAYVMEAVKKIRANLKPDIPLIGFAGAPFTLACYLMGPSHGGPKVSGPRTLMAQNPRLWDALMEKLAASTVSYLNAQVAAGTQVLQLFDSWVGGLTPGEFGRFVLPTLKQIIQSLAPGIPVIYFGTETSPFFPRLKETGASVIGVDWRVPLDEAWKELGDVALQGNLDPQALLTTPGEVRQKTMEILRRAGNRPGHIFNLGHGILPQTPLDNVKAMVETVKQWRI